MTGASGFIGRQCLHALREYGFESHALSSRLDDEMADGIVWHRANLLDPAELDRVVGEVEADLLLHLAWYATPGVFWTSLENYRWVAASLQLFRAFAEAGGRRIVAAGSCAEYDWSAGVCSEHTPLDPQSPYGVCKAALHNMLESFARRVGISAAWGRVFFTFGPHENPSRLVAGITSALLRGSAAPCSEGTQARDFLHVSDIGDAFAALLASDVAGAVNIASGEAISVRDLVEMIAARTGGRELLRFGAVPLSPNEPPLIVADVSRLRDELKWAPRVSLIERIDGTIEWWRAVLNAGSAGVVTGDQLPPARMRVSP